MTAREADVLWLRECPHQDQGLVRPLVSAEGVVVLFCDSADCIWCDPGDVSTAPARDVDPSSWAVATGVHLNPGRTRWATLDDLPAAWRRDHRWHGTGDGSPVHG